MASDNAFIRSYMISDSDCAVQPLYNCALTLFHPVRAYWRTAPVEPAALRSHDYWDVKIERSHDAGGLVR